TCGREAVGSLDPLTIADPGDGIERLVARIAVHGGFEALEARGLLRLCSRGAQRLAHHTTDCATERRSPREGAEAYQTRTTTNDKVRALLGHGRKHNRTRPAQEMPVPSAPSATRRP